MLRTGSGAAVRRLAVPAASGRRGVQLARFAPPSPALSQRPLSAPLSLRRLSLSASRAQRPSSSAADAPRAASDEAPLPSATDHAVISVFDLFSIGIGPSSSHTLGPMRAGAIFATELLDAGLLPSVERLVVHLYGSLAATGEGHMTPQALLLGLEGVDAETVDTAWVPQRYAAILADKELRIGSALGKGEGKRIAFDSAADLRWMWGEVLPLHSNGMRLSAYDAAGDLLATNDYYSVGGGFVVNGAMSTGSSSGGAPGEYSTASSHPVDLAENFLYKAIRPQDAAGARRAGASRPPLASEATAQLAAPADSAEAMESGSSPLEKQQPNLPERKPSAQRGPVVPFVFWDAASLLALTRKHNMTIAQIVYENELALGRTPAELRSKLFRIWDVMDTCVREGVHAEETHLPGSLNLRRRAPALYQRLTRGFYTSKTRRLGEERAAIGAPAGKEGEARGERRAEVAETRSEGAANLMVGRFDHAIMPIPSRRHSQHAPDWLSAYAIAVNEVNASGGRVCVAPTLGAAGVIPATLKYFLEFISDDEERDVQTFLLTAGAIGMLFKRGATISAAEGGCMAEIGSACAMAAGAFAACMGARPSVIENAAEIGIEHNLGLTCDPIAGLVQAPCIERNALGAVKAVVAAQLALANPSGEHAVSLDDAISAMRATARGMRVEFKETSLSGLATSVRIPVSVPDC